MSDQVSTDQIARLVLESIGGRENVLSNSLCMTRLRLRLANPGAIDTEALESIPSVLGLATRGANGIEVVFGPRLIRDVYDSFAALTGLNPSGSDDVIGTSPLASNLRVHIASSRPSEKAYNRPTDPEDNDLSGLARLDEIDAGSECPDESGGDEQGDDESLRVLVINGPNINMVGIREPGVYGVKTYDDLLVTCKEAAREAGFAECSCFQSNHEGDIVDRIQDAYRTYDGIVINPGAYTHTSIAILDALKAVSIPTVEVHISKVDERESFRQISYVRMACFETVMGMGIDGYRKAIYDLYAYLTD